MKLSNRQYVPVLKLKAAEKEALCLVHAGIRGNVIPLFEVVARKENPNTRKIPTGAEHLDTAFKGLAGSVSYYAKYFLDPIELDADQAIDVGDVFRRGDKLGRPFTPVTGLRRLRCTSVALEHKRHGLAIRLSRTEMESDKISKAIAGFMTQHRLSHDAVDLIVDLGAVESMVPSGVLSLAKSCLAAVPEPAAWRSLILSGCDFPKSMGEVSADSHEFADRSHWLAWRNIAKSRGYVPIPTFSDCAIQHSAGVEGVDMRLVKPAPSIRYALDEQWLLIKGSGSKLPSEQYSDLAGQLTIGDLSGHFHGPGHCKGCDRMRRAAEHEPEANSRKDWRQFGTIHHITRTVESIRVVCDQLDAGGPP